MPELLLIEDDAVLGETLSERLSSEGYSVSWQKSLSSAMECSRKKRHDIALIDVGLPDGDGFSFVRELKDKMPFLFLTAMNSAEFRLEAYELGADDYIPKPFHFKELILRLKRVLDKYQIKATIDCDGCMLHTGSGTLRYPDGNEEILSQKESSLLTELLTRAPKVVTRTEIQNKIWNSAGSHNARTIDNVVLRLRQTLSKTGKDHIKTVRGLGYNWEP